MNTPEENTLTPEAVRRALAQSKTSARRTDTIVSEAAETFGKARDIGQRNGFTDGVKALLRGTAA